MMDHPWMKADLSDGKKLTKTKTQLEKYVSVRKEKSYKEKKNTEEVDI